MPTAAVPTKPAPIAPATETSPIRARIPNALTLARFVLAGVFIALLSGVSAPWVAADASGFDRVTLLFDEHTTRLVIATLVFVLAALTDTLDGLLARRWNAESRFGRVMDPLADKILVIGGFVLLAGPTFSAVIDGRPVQLSGVEPWMAIVIFAREMLVTSIRGIYEAEGFDFSAVGAGKLKMIAQSVGVPVILLLVALTSPVPGSAARPWVLALAWGTTLITVASALPYLLRAHAATTGKLQPKLVLIPRPEPELGRPREGVHIPATHTRKKKSARRAETPGPAKRKNGAGGRPRKGKGKQ